jgi:hypothetical protein
MRKRDLRLGVAICAAVLTMAVAAVAQDDDGTPVAPGGDVAQVTAVESTARQAASVLERSRHASDELPDEVMERIDAEPRFGMNPGLARRAIASPSSSLYLVPANGHVCAALTVGEGASLSCPETVDLAAGQSSAATVLLAGGAIAIYGLVPDGVETVAVDTSYDGLEQAEVTGNAYMAVVPGGTELDSVTYDGPSGVVEFPIYDPSAP